MTEFEVFHAKSTKRQSRTPMISIQKKGVIMVNAPALALLGTPEAVELLYARATHAIGIRPAPPDGPYSYPLRSIPASASRLISGSAYLRAYGIPTRQILRLPAHLDGGTLVARIPRD